MTKPPSRLLAIVAVATCSLLVAVSAQNNSGNLDDGRQWFERRANLTAASPPILRAAAASAFNDTATAEPLLRDVIRSDPQSTTASQAHELLSRIYVRTGQYARLIENLDAWAKSFPGLDAVERERRDAEQFRGLPDQRLEARRASVLRHEGGIDVPVSINGTTASLLLDTGAWVSVMTEADAARVGLELRDGTGALSDPSGRGVRIRFGVAKTVVIGEIRFRDVSFAVIPGPPPESDSTPPSPPGGIAGIPVLLGLGVVRWSEDGTVELAGSSERDTGPNLAFFRNKLVVRTSVLGDPVFGTLDTGAVTSDLNSNFADRFSELVERTGTKSKSTITGVGGSSTIEGITMPEVAFQIGAATVGLRPAVLTFQRNPALGGECCVANVGLDLVMQRREFTIDFARMILRLD